jgi:hypothetical protein
MSASLRGQHATDLKPQPEIMRRQVRIGRNEARALLKETVKMGAPSHIIETAIKVLEVRAAADAALKIEREEWPIVAEDFTLVLARRVGEARERGDHELAERWAVLTKIAMRLAERDLLSRIAHLKRKGLR